MTDVRRPISRLAIRNLPKDGGEKKHTHIRYILDLLSDISVKVSPRDPFTRKKHTIIVFTSLLYYAEFPPPPPPSHAPTPPLPLDVRATPESGLASGRL